MRRECLRLEVQLILYVDMPISSTKGHEATISLQCVQGSQRWLYSCLVARDISITQFRKENLVKRMTLLIILILTLFPSLVLTQDDDRVTIRFWHIWGNVTWLPDVVEPAFEAAFPQYDLELRVLDGYNNAYDLYTLAQEQGDPPELLQGTSSNTQAPRDSGFFKPLHEAVDGRTEINGLPVRLDEIVGPAATFYQLDDEYYELPWNASTPILFANMDLLVEAGLAEDVDDVDAIPGTWAEVTEACAVIIENLDDVDCILFGAGGWYFENALAMQGAYSANNENGRGGGCVTEVVFNNDAGVAYQNWNNSLEDAGYWVDYGRSEYNITWANSQLALHMTSSAAARGRVEIGEGNGFTVAAGRMPYNQDVPYVGNTVGGGMILLTDGLEPEVEEGALTFLMFLLEPEKCRRMAQVNRVRPDHPIWF